MCVCKNSSVQKLPELLFVTYTCICEQWCAQISLELACICCACTKIAYEKCLKRPLLHTRHAQARNHIRIKIKSVKIVKNRQHQQHQIHLIEINRNQSESTKLNQNQSTSIKIIQNESRPNKNQQTTVKRNNNQSESFKIKDNPGEINESHWRSLQNNNNNNNLSNQPESSKIDQKRKRTIEIHLNP